MAWKFAVTERTIQSDLKYLIDNGYIERQINKTYLNRQTKNSYKVNLSKEKDFEYIGDQGLSVIVIAKESDKYYILTSTDYNESIVVRGKININDFTFELPYKIIKTTKDWNKDTIEILAGAFGNNPQLKIKQHGIVCSYISKGSYKDGSMKKPEIWKEKLHFSCVELDKCHIPRPGYKWLTLNVAPRRIKKYGENKGVHFVAKNILGVK